jgi:hypothetical protein
MHIDVYHRLPDWLKVHVRASYLAAAVVAIVALASGSRAMIEPFDLILAPIAVLFAGVAALSSDLPARWIQLRILFFVAWLAFCSPAIIRYYRDGYRNQRIDQRLRTGRCPRCGYHLRATRHRCPECGFVPGRDDPEIDTW